jgi:serine/threonine protein kinase
VVEPTPLSEPVNSENVHRSGQIVDQYCIVRLIAVGGTARVYEAVHQFTHKSVALKVMRGRLASRRDVVERFRQEAVALSSLRHENIVAVDNAGLTDDARVFIAMELLRGKTLRDLLGERAKLSQQETIQIMTQVASGVSAAHQGGVVHRDLKPENIFCVLHGPVKVLDLGTAKYAGEDTPSIQTAFGRVVGTAAYMAPERFEGDPGDVRSDVYALGLITYECLAGYHPLVPNGRWPDPVEMASRQLSCELTPIQGIRHELWQVIAKATHKAPKRRYESATAFMHALRNAQVSPTAPERPLKKGWGGQLVVPVIAGTLCGMTVSGMVQWLRFAHLQSEHNPVEARAPVTSVVVSDQSASVQAKSASGLARPANVDAAPAMQHGVLTVSSAVVRSDAASHPKLTRSSPSLEKGRPIFPNKVDRTNTSATEKKTEPNPLGGYESAHGSYAPKDNLPASGL